MQSIGERLEDARKRKGISLREAAEATKIRSDFLGHIEQNQFEFDLPDIYKLGFLKNYARYLKLDPEKIVADYNAQLLSNSRLGKRDGGSEWFGQMEVKRANREAPAQEQESAASESSFGRIGTNPTAAVPDNADTYAQDSDDDDDAVDKVFYMKAGLVCVGTLALVFVIFGLIRAILGSSAEDIAAGPELRDEPAITETADTSGSAETEAAGENQNVFTLTATGTVYVMVRQRENNEELYRNTMSEGETITLEKEGPVDILFTAGENLVIDHGGERLRPSSSGTAKISLP